MGQTLRLASRTKLKTDNTSPAPGPAHNLVGVSSHRPDSFAKEQAQDKAEDKKSTLVASADLEQGLQKTAREKEALGSAEDLGRRAQEKQLQDLEREANGNRAEQVMLEKMAAYSKGEAMRYPEKAIEFRKEAMECTKHAVSSAKKADELEDKASKLRLI